LGGKNAIVVLDDADLPLAVDGALWAAFGTSGQRCTAASRLIVDKKVAGDFVDLLQERAAKMKVGDGLQPDVDMGPVINEAALKVANSTQDGLSMSIYTNDLRKAFHAMDEMQSGIVYVNAPTIGAEIQLPFGGVKNTGNGHREAGTVALDEFTEWKTIYVDYSGRLQRAQIDTGE